MGGAGKAVASAALTRGVDLVSMARCVSDVDCSTCTESVGSLADRRVNGPRSAWSKRESWGTGPCGKLDSERLSSLYDVVEVAVIIDAGILSVDPPRALVE